MQPSAFATVLDGRDFLEGPRWHAGRLWLSDFYQHEVLAQDAAGGFEVVARVPRQPSGLGWLPDGRLLIVSMLDQRLLRQEPDGSLVVHADLSGLVQGPCNDMVVDERGRAYVGSFGFDLMAGAPLATSCLVLVAPDGQARRVADGLFFPNGCVITPDGRTLLVCETFGNRVSAFDVSSDGTLGPRRDWAVFGPVPTAGAMQDVRPQLSVGPDGAALDAEGCLWLADAIGRRLLRVREGGAILDEFPTGAMQVFACALGGPERRTLYACVAPDSLAPALQGAGTAALWSLEVTVPGAGRP